MRLKNRVALVTGGGKGMGKAISLAYAREGAEVIVNDILYDRAREVAAEIQASGRQALPDGADVSDSQAVNRMVRQAIDKFGKIDILVNCAGILLVRKIVEMTDPEWAKVLAVNLNGAFYCTRAVLAQSMIPRGSGKIIHFASITPLKGEGLVSAYAASKGGIIGFTKALSRELASKRINVNAIAPGFIDTDQTRDEFVGENRERIRKQIAFRHIGLPNDIVGIAVFLASEESAYLTGQTIVVDGGVV
jgi:NAD(P)-dependent dehydrogenase (short-subunit alcohol dehydrogenase family)